MKYRKIGFTNHPILGTVTFDFVNQSTGFPYQNVILAGENGIGKTVLLQFINTFSPQQRRRDVGVVHLEIEVDDEDIRKLIDKNHETYGKVFSEGDLSNHLFVFDWDGSDTSAQNWGIGIYTDKDGIEQRKQGYLFTPLFRSIFSRAEINFTPKTVKAITALEIDQQDLSQSASSENLSTEIKQLLVDIHTQDALDCQEWIDAHPGVSPPDSVRHSRLHRFTEAFQGMFVSKRLVQVNTRKGSIDVIFEENGKKMSIDVLSSGEKEIVFRGAYLLKDKQKSLGAIALVDEPELSMHPKWEIKILDYYKNLFKDVNGNQLCQLFIATHSVHVLKKALENKTDDLVIMLNRASNGRILCTNVTAPNKLGSVTSAETTYLAFGIYSVDYHIELFSEYQRRYGLNSIKAVDNSIMGTAEYNADLTKHHKHSEFWKNGVLMQEYETVCCLVRNHIDHPDTSSAYTEEDLINSTELLRSLL